MSALLRPAGLSLWTSTVVSAIRQTPLSLWQKWNIGDSNPVPSACKTDALPDELMPHNSDLPALNPTKAATVYAYETAKASGCQMGFEPT